MGAGASKNLDSSSHGSGEEKDDHGGGQLYVSLKMDNYKLEGDLIPHVYGSVPLVGSWDTSKVLAMERESTSMWELSFVVPPNHDSFVLEMGFLDLLSAASTPILKVLIITALGSILAMDSVDILGPSASNYVNNVVFFVSNPALVGSNLTQTITLESINSMWFMPVNIIITFIIGAALGWLLFIITKPPIHLKGLILGVCSAGNMGNLPLIIVPAVCKEKGSPFGDPDVCHEYALAYATTCILGRF